MTVIVAFCSQKGGVGKSTLARALAAYMAGDGFSARVVDLDMQQRTTERWATRREASGVPLVPVEVVGCANVSEALNDLGGVDVLIIDGYARSSEGTLKMAQAADVVVQPTNGTEDDCEPAVLVFYDLYKAGIDPGRMLIALSRLTTETEERDGRAYFESAEIPIKVLDGALYQKRAYGKAQDAGRSVLETDYDSLNDKARSLLDALVSEIVAARKKAGVAA